MKHWQILDLEPTQDERLVRKAYAKQLKTIDQDLEPDRFIRLREALESARNDIRYGLFEESDNEDDEESLDQDVDVAIEKSDAHVDESIRFDGEYFPHNALPAQPYNVLINIEPHILNQSSRSDFYIRAGLLADKLRAQDTDADLVAAIRHFLDQVNDSFLLIGQEKIELRLKLNQAAIDGGLLGIDDFIESFQPMVQVEQIDEPISDRKYSKIDSFSTRFEDLSQRLLTHQLTDDTYALFVEVLDSLPYQPLASQMDAHDRLIFNLAMASDADVNDKNNENQASERFVRYWLQTQGNERPLVNMHPSLYELYQRMSEMQSKDLFWQTVPAKYLNDVRRLCDGTGKHYLSMLRLAWSQDPYIKQHRNTNWVQLPIEAPESNFNVQLLGQLKLSFFILFNWAALVVVGIASSTLMTAFNLEGLITFWLSILIAMLWIPVVHAPICAWIVVSPIARKSMVYLAQFWLISALILSVGLVYLSHVAQDILLAVWAIIGALVWSVAKFERLGLLFWMRKVNRYELEGWLGFGSLFIFWIVVFNLITLLGEAQVISKHVIFLVLLPCITLLYPTYFMEIFKSNRVTHSLWAYGMLLIEFGVVFSSGKKDLINLFKDQISLSMVVLLSIWVVFIQPKHVAYFLKYIPYLSLIVLVILWYINDATAFPATIIFSLFASAMMALTYHHDRIAWNNNQP